MTNWSNSSNLHFEKKSRLFMQNLKRLKVYKLSVDVQSNFALNTFLVELDLQTTRSNNNRIQVFNDVAQVTWVKGVKACSHSISVFASLLKFNIVSITMQILMLT